MKYEWITYDRWDPYVILYTHIFNDFILSLSSCVAEAPSSTMHPMYNKRAPCSQYVSFSYFSFAFSNPSLLSLFNLRRLPQLQFWIIFIVCDCSISPSQRTKSSFLVLLKVQANTYSRVHIQSRSKSRKISIHIAWLIYGWTKISCIHLSFIFG